jgi:hypothetical protein
MIFLFFLASALAGEPVKKGFVVKEDSYLFSLPEAQQLTDRLSELEKIEKLYIQQKDLISAMEQQEVLYKSTIDAKDKLIDQHKSLVTLEQDRVGKLQKQQKWNDVKVYSAFVFGIGLTIGSFVVADNITDTLERN